MEKHKCQICMRSFPNGRAFGGHMRSHVVNHPIPPKPEDDEEEEANPEQTHLTIDELGNSASSSSSSEDEGEEEDDMIYGLRENPKRSIKLVDPEFSFAVDAGSVVLQDRESETESSKKKTRRRSKRTRKSAMTELHHYNHNQYHHHQKLEAFKKLKLKNKVVSSKADSFEPEPVSSISDATTEEDVAFCLMMLSRDKWKNQDHHHHQHEQQQEQEQDGEAERSTEDTDDSEEHLIKFPRTRTARGKYKCETCNKVFKSYQALGGHRASHKKIKASNLNPIYEPELEQENPNAAGTSSPVAERKIHECPVCFRVFSSGQALGGHKRSHVMTGSAAAAAAASNSSRPLKSLSKLGDSLIDLNLPAPVDDDDISQIELSAVSDAEFVNHIRR